jgi:signal transduction histidine kinase
MLDHDGSTLAAGPIGLVDEALLAEEVRQAERRDIARELHDTVIQPLTSLAMSFESLQYQPVTPGILEAHLGAWRELAYEALDSLRATLAGLHTHPHAQLGLPDALHCYLAPQLRCHSVRLAIECRDWPVDLPLDLTSILYLIVRELLTNVEKHAHATEATVLMRADGGALCLIVTDNGVGFSHDSLGFRTPRRRGSGLGLTGIRERVEMLGGRVAYRSAPGQGVQVELRIPVAPQPGRQNAGSARNGSGFH